MQPILPSKRREPVKTIIGLDGIEHKFYQIDLADELTHARHMIAEIQTMYIRFGISEQFLSRIMDELINEALNNNDLNALRQNVIALAQNLQGRIGRIAEKSMYEDLACVYFMMDEEPAEFDLEYQNKKKAVWRAAGEADFFTLEAFRLTNGLKSISAKDISTVWQAVEERVAQLKMLIEP